MIISRTPLRISFFGGGTDYPDWAEKYGGMALSTTIDKYIYINCRWLPPFFEHKYRITYSKLEDVKKPEEIEHPAIRAALKRYNFTDGLEIHCDADLPARSGLGSSSSFMVGLLNALEGLQGKRATQKWLAESAINYERNILNETVGMQDQVASAYGGLNIIKFGAGNQFEVYPFVMPAGRKKELENHLLLFFSGICRSASEVAKAQVADMEKNTDHLFHLKGMVTDGADILDSNRNIMEFGELLDEAWKAKKKLSSNISTDKIDELYARAKNAGAVGGKLLGAGGGGFFLLFVPPDKKEKIIEALKGLVIVPFNFENTGSSIIYHAD